MLIDCKPGDSLEAVVLVSSCQVRQTKKIPPKSYWDLSVRDRTAQLAAKVWDPHPDDEVAKPGDFMRIKAAVEEYRDELQLNIKDFEYVQRDQVKIEDFLPSSTRPADQMWADLFQRIKGDIGEESLCVMLQSLISDAAIKPALLKSPAATMYHHAWVGGLLEHILSMWNAATLLHQNYPWLKRDILLAGCVVHDLGKTLELSADTAFEYTPIGKLVGHVGIGTHLVWTFCNRHKLSKELTMQILHVVQSHHGDEHGAVKPQTAEAVAFHYIDNLDAKLAGIHAVFNQTKSELGFSERVPIMGREIYR